MEHGQIYSFLKTQTKTEVGFFRPSWVFPTAQKKRLTSIDEPCKDVGIL